jgi:alkyl sulfatase BDS1-like metallo-beta-lactamase superfamily hydrolase
MGGADAVLEKAQTDFANGNYRWVAEVVNHVIFANPESSNPHTTNPQVIAAKNLQADALEQLGYQAESGPWRNAYLTGAYELRHGVPHRDPKTAPLSPSVISAMTLDQYFDYMGLRFNAPKAEAAQLASTTINWMVNDNNTYSYYAMEFMDYTIPYTSYPQDKLPPAPITVKIDRSVLNSLADSLKPAEDFLSGVQSGTITVAGNVQQVADIFAMLDVFPADFNIVTPGQVQDNVP